MKKRLISIITTLSIIISLCSISASASMEKFPDQSAAISAYQKLWDSFDREDGFKVIYPDEYGGEFLDGDMLYIYIVNLTDDVVEDYLKIMDYPSCVEFLNAEYSLNYLESLKEQVRPLTSNYNISGYGVDRKNNRFNIDVCPTTDTRLISAETKNALMAEETILALARELSNPAVTFSIGNSMETCSALIGGGELSGYGPSGNYIGDFSTCIGGTYTYENEAGGTTTVPAILTAGHCVVDVYSTGQMSLAATYVKHNDVIIGTTATEKTATEVLGYQFRDGYEGDYAIIKLIPNSGYEPSNDVYYATSTLNINSVLPVVDASEFSLVGTRVYMHGSASQTTLSGIINDVDYEAAPLYATGRIYIQNMVQFQFVTTPSVATQGDSGGPVYMLNGGNVILLGNLSGTSLSNGSVTHGYYSPIRYAMYAGFTPMVA